MAAQQGGVTVAQYAQDYHGRRVEKAVAGGSAPIFYYYDRAGHLLGEIHGLDQTPYFTEYVWLDDMPVMFSSTRDGTIDYIHDDYLGTPQVMTDGSRNVVWDGGASDPFMFGQLPTSPAMNLRLPGQYFDSETGLHQNGTRDYDPTLGRYIESDPIGLDGGINTYAYANGNPVRFTDPSGLRPPSTFLERYICAENLVCNFPDSPPDTPMGGGSEGHKTEGGSEAASCPAEPNEFCHRRWEIEDSSCLQWINLGSRWVRACQARAADRRGLCIRNGGQPDPQEPPEWNPFLDYPR